MEGKLSSEYIANLKLNIHKIVHNQCKNVAVAKELGKCESVRVCAVSMATMHYIHADCTDIVRHPTNIFKVELSTLSVHT